MPLVQMAKEAGISGGITLGAMAIFQLWNVETAATLLPMVLFIRHHIRMKMSNQAQAIELRYLKRENELKDTVQMEQRADLDDARLLIANQDQELAHLQSIVEKQEDELSEISHERPAYTDMEPVLRPDLEMRQIDELSETERHALAARSLSGLS